MQDKALAASVVHDVKNSLAVLVEQLAALQVAAAGNPLSHEIASAHGLARSMSAKLINFLTLYRANSNGLVVATRDHNPEDFLHEVIAGLVLPRDAPAVAYDGSPESPAVWFFDGYLVRLALEAAIQNATRFACSRIDVSAALQDDCLVFSVEDDGPGLGSAGAPSTGLGTELCRAIAQAHVNGARAGTVALFNRVDGGARFELRLP